MHSIAKDHVQTVSELTQSIRGVLEVSFPFVTVAGEISNLRCPHSGHLYFTLKDATAQIKAVLFKPQQRYLPCAPADGMEVVCRGRISLYEARGEYQLIVDVLAAQGAGALQLAFDLLKSKLAGEGLFAEERKRPLPLLPEKIALITSPSGAAVHDFLSMAQKRCAAVPVEIIPVRVQGAGAMEDIVEAIALCNERGENDVIVLCRGGGSLEDLWTFNEERVRSTSPLPIWLRTSGPPRPPVRPRWLSPAASSCPPNCTTSPADSQKRLRTGWRFSAASLKPTERYWATPPPCLTSSA